MPDFEVSDIFFNLRHPTYEALLRRSPDDPASADEALEALTQDAQRWAGYTVFRGYTAEDLAADFMRRA